ncbi:MAG: hypothetical protein ACRDGO_03350 [Actinomycetota bacterium]
MTDSGEPRKLADEILPITQWSPLWIGMWVLGWLSAHFDRRHERSDAKA